MPDSLEGAEHVKPYVHQRLGAKALHFSISEVQSCMQLADPTALDLAYTRTMMGFLLFRPAPKRVAMVGLGGGSLAKFCYRYLPASHIEVVEINPHVIALRDEFHIPPDDARFSVVRGDGARYVQELALPVDVLLVDGFDSQGQPARLCSQRFYDACHDALLLGGILAVNLHFGHPHGTALLERIHRSFGGHVMVVDDDELSNTIVFGCKGQALPRAARTAPKGLAPEAAAQLACGFSLVRAALQDQAGRF